MAPHKVAVIKGDGIGVDVQAGRKFLAKSADKIKAFQTTARAKRAVLEGEVIETPNSETG